MSDLLLAVFNVNAHKVHVISQRFDCCCSPASVRKVFEAFVFARLKAPPDPEPNNCANQNQDHKNAQCSEPGRFLLEASADSKKKQRNDKENDHDESITFKMKRDPRVTWIGRIIRKLSLDELPQLWCVLKGEMSLVGPRPPVPSEVAQYTLADRRRLEAVPGLTCIWQVSGRGDIPFDQQVQLDVQYIESQSLWLDIKLLFRTVPAVLFGRGAY